jgi:hypothetical protein
MSFYTAPDDLLSRKSWNEMFAANMKALGMPEVKLPDLAMPRIEIPDFKLPAFDAKAFTWPAMPSSPSTDAAAAMSVAPIGFAAQAVGFWAAALDNMVATSQAMAKSAQGLPSALMFEWPVATETGEVIAFAPKAKPAKPVKEKATVAKAAPDTDPAPLALVEADAAPTVEAEVAAPAAPVVFETMAEPQVLESPVETAPEAAAIAAPVAAVVEVPADETPSLAAEPALIAPEDFKRQSRRCRMI